jgi:hypothetical protein
MKSRLAKALAAYAALAIIALFVLHGKPLWVVLILMVYFAFRTKVAEKLRIQRETLRDGQSQSETDDPEQGTKAEHQ